jgi:ABC-type glycerol-3-phosphate transport system substrate-binding protein
MKKILLLFAFVFASVMLVACKDDKPDPTIIDDQVEITYASWNLGSADSEEPNMERLMIDAFMEAYPNIKVTVI